MSQRNNNNGRSDDDSDGDDLSRFLSTPSAGAPTPGSTTLSRGSSTSTAQSRNPSLPTTVGRRSRTGSHASRVWPVDRWCFTAFSEHWVGGLPFAQLPPGVDYICGQPELCPTTQRPHFQGFVIFSEGQNVCTPEQCLAKLGIDKGHAEKCGSTTCTKAIDYTKKPNTAVLDANKQSQWRELGKVPVNQLKVGEHANMLLKMAEEGDAKFIDLLRASPSFVLRATNGVMKMLTAVAQDRDQEGPPLKVYLIWGKTGLGKSHSIFKFLSNPKLLYNKIHPVNTQATDFWEGYDGHDVVLFDDFNPVQYPVRQLLQYFHEWPIRVQVKGGSTKAVYKTVFITSNIAPNLWYPAEQVDPLHRENYAALWRRIPKENICRFVRRIPDDVDIKTFEQLKEYQDKCCEEENLAIMGDTEEATACRTKFAAWAKKQDRSLLERCVVDQMITNWQERK